MRTVKKLLSNIHRYVLWALISFLLWAWVFTFLTDTARKNKVVIYSGVPGLFTGELEQELSKALPDGIKMIKVHSFSYAMFDTSDAEKADIYLLTPEEVSDFESVILPFEETKADSIEKDGKALGQMLCSPDHAGVRAADFFEQGVIPEEGVCLCYSSGSVHVGEMNGSDDAAAVLVAEKLFELFGN